MLNSKLAIAGDANWTDNNSKEAKRSLTRSNIEMLKGKSV